MERESGVMYSPPSAYDWIIYGPALLLLRDPMPDFSADVIVDDREHGFLLSAMKQKLYFLKSKLDKISGILGWDTISASVEVLSIAERLQDQFKDREEQIIEIFHRIKVLHEEEENRQIKAQRLDPALIKAFQEKLYQKWLGNCLSYQLFRDKGLLETVTSADGLLFHGQKNLLEHQKMMFVNQGQRDINGSGDYGSIVGRIVDERFVYDITQLAPQQKAELDEDYSSVCAGLDAIITKVRTNEFEPDVIIVPANFFYKTDLVYSEKYKRLNLTEKSLQTGVYDNIPVLRLFTPGLNLKAIVASFSQALSLKVLTNQGLYEKIMHLQLRELTQEEVDERYEKDFAKWATDDEGARLTEEQAKLKLAASLMLEMWTKGKFEVVNAKAIAWCKFKPAAKGK